MSDEGRKARAQAMGFDTSQIWYHGSPQRDLTSMDPSAPKNANTVGDIEGMYFTTEPSTASGYSRPRSSWGQAGKGGPKPPRGQIYSVYLRMQNPLDITGAMKKFARKKGVTFSMAKQMALQAVDRSVHDGVIFHGNSMNTPEAIVFDPKNVRSVDAPFVDSDSAFLMSSLGESDDRLKRAQWMGFDTSKVWYHGSGESRIKSFSGFRNGIAGHFTLDPDFAQDFANAAFSDLADNISDEEMEQEEVAETMYPVFLRIRNTFDIRNPEHSAMIGLTPEETAMGDYLTLENNIQEITAAGFDSYRDYEDVKGNTISVAVFDPKNIRSIHAQFKGFDDANIMASKGINEVRGPHEGKELGLLLSGKKPLAMIEIEKRSEDEQALWKRAIDSGKLIHKTGRTITTQQSDGERHPTDFVAAVGEEWRIEKVQALYDKIERTDIMSDEDHTLLGQLLGYSGADIRHFVTGFDDDGDDGFTDSGRRMA